MKSVSSVIYLAMARGLTLARIAAILPFLLLLEHTAREGPDHWGMSLVSLYLLIALSDLLDGALARMAGAPSALWGKIDAAADIAFNILSLSLAAWIGAVGFWVPAVVAALGGRFILRNFKRRSKAIAGDRAGKIAGVLYYLLVGAVVLGLTLEQNAGWLVARGGDAVFFYTLVLLLHPDKGRLNGALSEKKVTVGLGQKKQTEGPVR
jgi:phosphatidylglycerophosphate synthase